MSVYIGKTETGRRISIPNDDFRTHLWSPGATGTGKTTVLLAMLHQMLPDRGIQAAHIILDKLGGLSFDLLRWVSSSWCPQSVRDRFLYIEAAREDKLTTFHPLEYTTQAHGYFKVGRALDCILRGFTNQDVSDQPRLAVWCHAALWATAQLGLTIADVFHILYPGSEHHAGFLNALRRWPLLRAKWQEVLQARGSEAMKMLEAVRNRMNPYVECDITKNFFGSTVNRFNIEKLMREKRIVLLNLAPNNRLSGQIGDAIGSMTQNEVFAVARSLPMGRKYPTFLWLDEFQNYVGPDMFAAIPEVRQLGIRLMLFNQSMSQLVRGDIDLTSLIYQPRTRLVFALQGEDADILAHEIASLTFDPRKVKEELYTRRQLLKGHKIGYLCSWSQSAAEAENWTKAWSKNWMDTASKSLSNGLSQVDGISRRESDPLANPTRSSSDARNSNETAGASSGRGGSESEGEGGSRTLTDQQSKGETLIPEYEEFLELSKREYEGFDEHRTLWAQHIRRLKTGQCLVKLPNDPAIYPVNVERHTPGDLTFDVETLLKRCPQAIDRVYRFIEKNYEDKEFFVTPQEIERETHDRLQRVLHPVIEVHSDEPLMIEHREFVDASLQHELVEENPLA